MKLLTIGVAHKKAEDFFCKLRAAGVSRVLDVRLNNTSQLAGFTKQEDLRYFLRSIAGIEYLHLPHLAPTKSMLDAYKKHRGDWSVYEKEFVELITARHIENTFPRDEIGNDCLLCSEEQPHYCHRRLVAEYLRRCWKNVSIEHIV